MTKCQIEIFWIQTKTIDNCLLDYGLQRNEGVMENVIVHVLNAEDFKDENNIDLNSHKTL